MNLLHDLRLVLRSLASRWRFSLLVVATMSVGIGTTVGIWSYLAYFVRPTLDAPEPSRLVWLENPAPDDRWRRFDVADWRDLESTRHELFSSAAASRIFGASLQSDTATIHVFGTAVSGEFFELLAARPALGRLLEPRDDRPEADPVLVLSNLTWRTHFGGDPGVIGKTVTLDGLHSYSVVGITEPGFQGTGFWAAVHTPLAHAGPLLSRTRPLETQGILILGRLHPDLTLEAAQSRFSSAAAGLDERRPLPSPRDARLTPVTGFGGESYSGEPIYHAAWILMAAVVLLLLLACANVASLMLAQGMARRRETAMHAALGAGRGRVMGRHMIECVLLSGMGGLLGLGFVPPILRLIEHYLRMDIPVSMGDWGAGTTLIVDEGELALFVAGVSILTGLLFGLAPLREALRLDLVASLKGDANPHGTGWRAKDVLVVAQVALSVVLLVNAALLGRTLLRFSDKPLGFQDKGLFLTTVYLPKERLNDPNDGSRLLRALTARVAAIPGVESASLAQSVPLSMHEEVRLDVEGRRATVVRNAVGSDYFHTLQIPLASGRVFEDRDDSEAPRVAVLNHTGAAELFPGGTAIGRILTLESGSRDEPGERVEIVGVVADSVNELPWRPMAPMLYLSFAQYPSPRPALLLRAKEPIERRVRDLLRAEYPDLALVSFASFEDQKSRALATPRMNADMSSGVALLGLLLAALGIFSVMSYLVSQRTREIGIRMALGAELTDVRRWVLSETMRRVGLGLALGIAGAWAQARLLTSLLVGVETRDPWIFAAVPAVLACCALVAVWIPARRATRVEPIQALRQG